MEKLDTCIYHAECLDGFTAAWAVWSAGNADATFVPLQYPDAPDVKHIAGKRAVAVDYHWPVAQQVVFQKVARELTVLDHHASALPISEMDGVTVDIEKSGARLAWEHFHPDEEPPWLIRYAEDRDLWKHELPRTHAVIAALSSYEFDFETWNRLSKTPWQAVADQGMHILRAYERMIVAFMKTAHRADFLGYGDVPVVTINQIVPFRSEVLGRLAAGDPNKFAVGWHQRADGLYKYSLRSTDDGPDVNQLAGTVGGGGHEHAAGFTSRLAPIDLCSAQTVSA